MENQTKKIMENFKIEFNKFLLNLKTQGFCFEENLLYAQEFLCQTPEPRLELLNEKRGGNGRKE